MGIPEMGLKLAGDCETTRSLFLYGIEYFSRFACTYQKKTVILHRKIVKT